MEVAEEDEDNLKKQAVEMLLDVCRDSIRTSDPMNALAAVLQAVKLTQGEEAIVDVLNAAKMRAGEESDGALYDSQINAAMQMVNYLLNDDSSLLFERGDETILKDAFEDGSSVVCPKCKALIPRSRTSQHERYWCSTLS